MAELLVHAKLSHRMAQILLTLTRDDYTESEGMGHQQIGATRGPPARQPRTQFSGGVCHFLGDCREQDQEERKHGNHEALFFVSNEAVNPNKREERPTHQPEPLCSQPHGRQYDQGGGGKREGEPKPEIREWVGVAHRAGGIEVEADVVDDRAQKLPGGGKVKASLKDERTSTADGEGNQGTHAILEAASACVEPKEAYGESQGCYTHLIAKPRAESDPKSSDEEAPGGLLSAEGQTDEEGGHGHRLD